MTRRQLLQGLAAMPIGFSAAVRATAQTNSEVAYGGTTLPLGIRSRFINNVNGITYHVLEAGFESAGRPCVLLIHGFPELAYSWRKVILPLARAGFHVIAPDLRGYGRSGGTDVTFDDNLAPGAAGATRGRQPLAPRVSSPGIIVCLGAAASAQRAERRRSSEPAGITQSV